MTRNQYVIPSRKRCPTIALLALVAVLGVFDTAYAQEDDFDNGTDPSKLTTTAEGKYEYFNLNGGSSSGTLRLSYTQPFGEKKDYSWRLRVPVGYVDAFGDDSHDFGDISLQVQHVFGLTRKQAFVIQGEAIFDTAARDELGTGKNVFKGTLIYARFLEGGAIFAPAIVQSNSLGGQSSRADVNTTTFDFYYVPKLADPRNLITADPALNFDWESDKTYASVAVTFGRVLGPALGGKAIAFVKPTVFAGGQAPGSWGIELGYKIIGF